MEEIIVDIFEGFRPIGLWSSKFMILSQGVVTVCSSKSRETEYRLAVNILETTNVDDEELTSLWKTGQKDFFVRFSSKAEKEHWHGLMYGN